MKTMLAGLLVLAAGCSGLQSSDPASPYYAYGTGWTMAIMQPLTIPADAATVRLQYGRVVPRNGVQDSDPFCVVEVNTVRDVPRTLAAGHVEIVRVSRSVSQFVQRASPFRQVGLGDDDSPSFLYFVTEFQLRDPAQPDLRGMSCAWNQMAPGNRGMMRHLLLAEMESALGDWIRFIPPRSTP